MSETAASIRKHIVRLTPAEAEIRFLVTCPALGNDLHVRGRLMGPRCPYASTVEVAYPLKEIERAAGPGKTDILLKTIIPEPSMWDPQSPFLYSGPVGIWQRDDMLEQQTVQVGFIGWGLGTRGLRVNGQYVDLKAAVIAGLDENNAPRLRDTQVNCVVVDVRESQKSTWDNADRFGFFVLGRIRNLADWDRARSLEGRPSCLGWILEQGALAGFKPRSFEGTSYTGSAPLIGLEVDRLPNPLPLGISFLVARPETLEQSRAGGLPWLRIERAGEEASDWDLADGILGTLRNWPMPGDLSL
jgi:hypothetical protein